MALPKWITPAGQLGIVPELDYYQYILDAYDPSAGTLVYSLVSGRLPPGIQIKSTGILQGIPVSGLTPGDKNVTYTFSIRAKNSLSNELTDRTFSLTVTNVAPPLIDTPDRNSFLGLFLDGTEYEQQLSAIEFTPGADLTWSLESGDLPPGITLTSSGLLSGYFRPILNDAAGLDTDWDDSAWSYLSWDSSPYAIKKRFIFTIKVDDGVSADLSTYTLDVYPRSSLTVDHDDISVDLTLLGTGVPLTIDIGNKHDPIITTTQSDLTPVREGSFFSFKFSAVDLDGDTLMYAIPALSTGAFDEQDFSIDPSLNYVATTPVGGRISAGIYPDISVSINANTNVSTSTLDTTQAWLEPGDDIKVLNSSGIWQEATVTSSVTIQVSGNTIVTGSAGNWLTQASSGANATIASVSDTIGTLSVIGSETNGSINTILPTYQVTFKNPIVANVGEYITQASSGANARVTSSVAASTVANVIMIQGGFKNGNVEVSQGNIAINGANIASYPTANVKDIQNTTITANIGDFITQVGSTGNATVTANVSDAINLPVTFTAGTFNSLNGNIKINGTDAGVWITSQPKTTTNIGMNIVDGDYITQASTGANAVITSDRPYGTELSVRYISGTFATGSSSGNITVNGSTNLNLYPTEVLTETEITATYNISNYFDVNPNLVTSKPAINGVTYTYSNVTAIVDVGVTLGALGTEGTVGFAEGLFDQGSLNLPSGLSLVEDSGWLIGTLPSQTISQVEYEFEVVAYKENDTSYQDRQLYTLTVLGDLNNRIDWVTPTDLGIINTGKVSDLFVYATSSLGKTLVYELADGEDHRLPQGLTLTTTGLISGRSSFQVFSLDQGRTTVDKEETTFDFTYTFTVTARDMARTISADRTFTITIRQFDKVPYENLYLVALPSQEQRIAFRNIVTDSTLFPIEKIYRNEDPWFGVAKEIKSLFLPGLSPSQLEEYAQAVATNHFTKRLTFGEVRTARALDENFNVKYEVVYIEVKSPNTVAQINGFHTLERGPQDTIDLSNIIDTPYYDLDGNTYTTAYPNSFQNMESKIVSNIGYQNKGALPEWMTSRQENGRQLGFVHAVVLGYVKPGESELIAYRLKERNFNFNTIDFSVDRYQLDNILTANYDITANTYVTSNETTFDRYPALPGTLTNVATVDFAISTPFEDIDEQYIDTIKDAGGLDGIKNFKDGDTLVFAQQEYYADGSSVTDYNQGWSNVIILWDEVGWAYNSDTSDSDTDTPYDPTLLPPNPGPYDYTPGQNWDDAEYVTGYNENLLDPLVPNRRIGIWEIKIEDNIVHLYFKQEVAYYDSIYVRNGFTYGGTNIYYDPLVKAGNTIPNYSILPQNVNTDYTIFDGNGTRFYDNRDNYTVPSQGDKYIKFAKTGVFT